MLRAMLRKRGKSLGARVAAAQHENPSPPVSQLSQPRSLVRVPTEADAGLPVVDIAPGLGSKAEDGAANVGGNDAPLSLMRLLMVLPGVS